MAYTKATMRAVDKYVKNNYDRIEIKVPKGRKKAVEAFAKEHGESVNGMLNRLLQAEMGLQEHEWKEVGSYNRADEKQDDDDVGKSSVLYMISDMIWHSDPTPDKAVYHYLHQNPGYAETLTDDYERIENEMDFQKRNKWIDALISKIKMHMEA